MHKDCIILCHSTNEKGNLHCLQKINGKPFIEYLAAYFAKYHICKVIFSISAQRDEFKEYILSNRTVFSFSFDFAESETFEGSGTAVLHALQYSDTPDVLIMQGHKYFDVNLDDLIAWQQTKMGDVTMALSYQKDSENDLLAHLDQNNFVQEFTQGAVNKTGLIVGGIYCLFRPSFLNINFSQAFSFEEMYLQQQLKERDFLGMISEGYYLDLAQNDSLEKAAKDFPTIFFKSEEIEKNN